jgi:hypothetical protein
VIRYLVDTLTGDTALASFLDLQSLGSRKENTVPVCTVHVQSVTPFPQLDTLLQQRRRFTRQHGLVDDAGTAEEEKIARDSRIRFGAD